MIEQGQEIEEQALTVKCDLPILIRCASLVARSVKLSEWYCSVTLSAQRTIPVSCDFLLPELWRLFQITRHLQGYASLHVNNCIVIIMLMVYLFLQFVPYSIGEFVATAQKRPVHTGIKVCLSPDTLCHVIVTAYSAAPSPLISLPLPPPHFISPLFTGSPSAWCLQPTEAMHRPRPCICKSFTWHSCSREPSSTSCRISKIL